jgi:hypothetical protein
MNDGKPYVSPPPDADGPYKYYLIAGFRPVRVTCDERGRKIYAEATNREGVLELAPLVGKIEKDEDVDEITKGEFVEWCQDALSPAAYPKLPYVCPPPDADGPYKYYRHSGHPVRIFFNTHGRAVAAEAPSWKHGALVVQHVSLYPITDRARSLQITKDKFVELCLKAASDVGRGNENPHISRPVDADGPYKYCLLGTRPVRVTCDESGSQTSAETPGFRNGGALEIENILLCHLLDNPEVKDLTKAEFVEMCRRTASGSKP